MKTCTKCKVEKEITEFYSHKGRADKLSSECKSCTKKRNLIYNNTPKGRLTKRAHKLRERGCDITPERLEELLDTDTQCQICGTIFGIQKAHVDHCHNTGKLRGLLCQTCNTGIGHLKDDIQTLQKAIKYLEKHTELPTVNLDDKNPS